jgi:hypothetical protein
VRETLLTRSREEPEETQSDFVVAAHFARGVGPSAIGGTFLMGKSTWKCRGALNTDISAAFA